MAQAALNRRSTLTAGQVEIVDPGAAWEASRERRRKEGCGARHSTAPLVPSVTSGIRKGDLFGGGRGQARANT